MPRFRAEVVRSLAKFTHFGGDDGEAAANVAGACGLDRGVECEQVRLFGNMLDFIEGLKNLFDVARDRVDSFRDANGNARRLCRMFHERAEDRRDIMKECLDVTLASVGTGKERALLGNADVQSAERIEQARDSVADDAFESLDVFALRAANATPISARQQTAASRSMRRV